MKHYLCVIADLRTLLSCKRLPSCCLIILRIHICDISRVSKKLNINANNPCNHIKECKNIYNRVLIGIISGVLLNSHLHCHSQLSQSVVTVSCHGQLSQSVVTVSCHGQLPRSVATAGCHGQLPRSVATVGCHGWLPRSVATVGCHGRLPRSVATVGCHGRLPRSVATVSCHSQLSHTHT